MSCSQESTVSAEEVVPGFLSVTDPATVHLTDHLTCKTKTGIGRGVADAEPQSTSWQQCLQGRNPNEEFSDESDDDSLADVRAG